jgi:hypothetical protein
LHFRALRFGAKDHQPIGILPRKFGRCLYGLSESAVIRVIVVGWKKRHERIVSEACQSEQAVKDSRAGTAIRRLHNNSRFIHARQFFPVKRFMSFYDDKRRALCRDCGRNPRTRLTQQRFATEKRAKLLGAVVARNKSAQCFQARSVAAGQDYGPELSMHRRFPPDVVFAANESPASWQLAHIRTQGSARRRSGAICVEQRTQRPYAPFAIRSSAPVISMDIARSSSRRLNAASNESKVKGSCKFYFIALSVRSPYRRHPNFRCGKRPDGFGILPVKLW